MKHLLLSSALLLPVLAYAQVNDQRNVEMIKAEFDRLHHTASINCEYKWWLNVDSVETVKQTYTPNKSVSALYKIGDTNLNIEVSPGPNRGNVYYELSGTRFSGSISKYNYIHLDLNDLSPKQQAISEKYNLPNLTCSLEIALEDNYVVEDKDVHIAMHPYNLYDLAGRTLPATMAQLDDQSKHQLLLLDDVANIRKGQTLDINEFLVTGAPDLEVKPLMPRYTKVWQQIPFDIPEDISMKVAPAGHLRFTLTRPDHEFTYTGGNHNYCIMNSNRRALNAFFENPNSKEITFNYIKEGIVVQWKSFKGMGFLNIPKSVFKKSNRLSDVMKNMSESQLSKYFDGHFNWYAGYFLGTKQYMFGKATLIRKGIGADKVQVVQGKGSGDITITFNYI